MEELNDFECPICLEFCREAVQSECCAHAFCKECSDEFIIKKKECPFCRSPDFKTRESRILRRVISQIKVDCPHKGCEKKVSTADLEKHTQQCQHRLLKCKNCAEELLVKHLLEHTMKEHRDQLHSLLVKSHSEPNTDSKIKSQVFAKPTIFNPMETVKTSQGRQAGLGTTGKYYCGGSLGFKCRCCDGDCGPTNGENCIGCMQLDVKLRSLPPGFLVNVCGNICKIEDNRAFCGTLTSGVLAKTQCIKTKQCNACLRTTNSLPRYQTLLR